MSISVTYKLADFKKGARVAAEKLLEETVAKGLSVVLEGVRSDRETCTFDFADKPTDEDLALLNVVVEDHGGTKTAIKFHASSVMILQPVEITSVDDWQVLGKARADPSFFIDDLANAVGRVVFEAAVDGDGAELKIVEDTEGDEKDVSSTPFKLPDTGAKWKPFKFSSDQPPRKGPNVYRLEGRLNGAKSAFVDTCAIAALEIITS